MDSVKATKRHVAATWALGAAEVISVLLGMFGPTALYLWGKIIFSAATVVVLFIAFDSCRTTKMEQDLQIKARYHKINIRCVWINIAIALIGRII